MNKILKIGHRGAAGYEPENTLVAFQKALEMDVEGIELDVHLSSDGHLIVIHDETIDKTTNGNGFVNALSLSELKSFRTEKEQQIPTLGEVLNLVNRQCFINIELKGNATAQPVVALIERYFLDKNWKYTDFLISSFDWSALREVRLLNSKIPIGVLTQTDLDLAIAFATFIQAETIHPCFHLLSKEKTIEMQKKGFQVLAWTVNEAEDIQKIKSFEVNGIISDFPERILNH
jgi:glycerophosphoryl diester phosphodiesterase